MLLLLLLLFAETPQEHAARVRALQESSISLQRASVRVQSESLRPVATPNPAVLCTTGYSPPRPPPCDPLPPPELTNLIESASEAENLAPSLIREVARQESGFYPCAISSKGAMGLMQLMPATQIELGVSDPWDPRQNIQAGTRLLRQLLEHYQGNVALALGAYNAGAGRVDRAQGIPPIPETRSYVDTILTRLSMVPDSPILASPYLAGP